MAHPPSLSPNRHPAPHLWMELQAPQACRECNELLPLLLARPGATVPATITAQLLQPTIAAALPLQGCQLAATLGGQ